MTLLRQIGVTRIMNNSKSIPYNVTHIIETYKQTPLRLARIENSGRCSLYRTLFTLLMSDTFDILMDFVEGVLMR